MYPSCVFCREVGLKNKAPLKSVRVSPCAFNWNRALPRGISGSDFLKIILRAPCVSYLPITFQKSRKMTEKLFARASCGPFRRGSNVLVLPSEELWRPRTRMSSKECPEFFLQATETFPRYTHPSLFMASLEVQLLGKKKHKTTHNYLIKKKYCLL